MDAVDKLKLAKIAVMTVSLIIGFASGACKIKRRKPKEGIGFKRFLFVISAIIILGCCLAFLRTLRD
jgi:hypothetical protein